MEYTSLPGLEKRISRIGLGTWVIGGWMWGGADEGEAIAAIETAIDGGICFVDTAPVYGFGRAEEIVGKAIRRVGRDKVVIATKAGLEWNEREEIRRNSSPERLRREIEESLRRLGIDSIDLYQIHWPDPRVPIESTAQTLLSFRSQGKIRALGVSNFSPNQMDAWRKAAPLHTDQPPYNLFERGIERDVLPYCRENGIGVVAYGVLCRGLLTGKFQRHQVFGTGDIRCRDPKFQGEAFLRSLSAVDDLRLLAQARGWTLPQLAAKWALQQPGISLVLWGARTPKQISDAIQLPSSPLSDRELAEIDRILERRIPEPIGPEFLAPPL
ncbi:methylglyoxal reductase [Methylacidimicrobium cyclopophantes]|uniref:Methylglyoxal reductase n=1 Tax=Methylacidimicrobium cyclopophantes TaxID=1041766 RepID=A0A5E6MKI4_9BACT|nr:aldo/keto reductase [Methylacidimicrobium cyclopophantes]VVM08487.1 methylglyoxal reductase [Methylacidimicrobium cyclopophantes]